MFETLEQSYLRKLNNTLAFVSQVVSEVNRNKTATYEEKLKVLQQVQQQLNEAKRALIFLMNTGGRR